MRASLFRLDIVWPIGYWNIFCRYRQRYMNLFLFTVCLYVTVIDTLNHQPTLLLCHTITDICNCYFFLFTLLAHTDNPSLHNMLNDLIFDGKYSQIMPNIVLSNIAKHNFHQNSRHSTVQDYCAFQFGLENWGCCTLLKNAPIKHATE